MKGEAPFQDRRVNPFPTFLLCDYDLKISRGPELVLALRAIPSCASVPIFMFSDSDDMACILDSYVAGADGYLRKPAAAGGLDTFIQTLYACAMSEPQRFEALTQLREYQPPPLPIAHAASVVYQRAL